MTCDLCDKVAISNLVSKHEVMKPINSQLISAFPLFVSDMIIQRILHDSWKVSTCEAEGYIDYLMCFQEARAFGPARMVHTP